MIVSFNYDIHVINEAMTNNYIVGEDCMLRVLCSEFNELVKYCLNIVILYHQRLCIFKRADFANIFPTFIFVIQHCASDMKYVSIYLTFSFRIQRGCPI